MDMLGGRTHAEEDRRKDRAWRVEGCRRRENGDNREHRGCVATAEGVSVHRRQGEASPGQHGSQNTAHTSECKLISNSKRGRNGGFQIPGFLRLLLLR